MNKTKRNLILASAIVNLVGAALNLIMSILVILNVEAILKYTEFVYFVGFSTNIIYAIISFAVGLIGSIFLIFSVRKKGKYFRTTQGLYIAGLIIVVVCGGMLAWILLFISMFIPDVIIMNTPHEVRREEVQETQAYELKKKKIEELKALRDSGAITEEEYKEKLFELL